MGRGGYGYLLHHIEATTAAIQLWEDVVVLEQSRKNILWVKCECPDILHTALQKQFILSFTEVLSLSHPSRPELEEGAALYREVHVEREVGDNHSSELLNPGVDLCQSVKRQKCESVKRRKCERVKV